MDPNLPPRNRKSSRPRNESHFTHGPQRPSPAAEKVVISSPPCTMGSRFRSRHPRCAFLSIYGIGKLARHAHHTSSRSVSPRWPSSHSPSRSPPAKTSPRYTQPSLVRVIDASYIAPAVNVQVEGTLLAANIGQGTITPYGTLRASNDAAIDVTARVGRRHAGLHHRHAACRPSALRLPHRQWCRSLELRGHHPRRPAGCRGGWPLRLSLPQPGSQNRRGRCLHGSRGNHPR